VYVKRSGQLDLNVHACVQQILPDSNDLREIPERLKQDYQATVSSQRAQLQHPYTPLATTSFPQNAPNPKDDESESPHLGTLGSIKQVSSTDSTANELRPPQEAQEASIKDGNEEKHTACGVSHESEDPNLSIAPYPCFCDAMANKFQILMQQKIDVVRSIQNLSSLFVDASLRQVQDPMSADVCHFAQDSAVHVGQASSAGHARHATGESFAQEPDSSQQGMIGGEDQEARQTRTCGSGTSFQAGRKRGLLGECGPAIKAAYQVLKEIEDVHCSDELMHFEFCGPFWELSEVWRRLFFFLPEI
jgi:hypothetical protein